MCVVNWHIYGEDSSSKQNGKRHCYRTGFEESVIGLIDCKHVLHASFYLCIWLCKHVVVVLLLIIRYDQKLLGPTCRCNDAYCIWDKSGTSFCSPDWDGVKCEVKAVVLCCCAGQQKAQSRALGKRRRNAASVKSRDGTGWSQGRVHGNAFNCCSLWDKNWNFIKSN